MGRHLVFDSDVSNDPASTPVKRPFQQSPGSNKKSKLANGGISNDQLTNGHSNNGQLTNGHTPKQKVINFDESDQEEFEQVKNKKEEKQKRILEAKRLEISRKKLPIWEGKDVILKAVEENDTVVVLGETGSGKTTQVPQFLFKSNICKNKPRICCTQPRRVAAISLATRVATEVGCSLGSLVGYSVRFASQTSPGTRLTYMTDGTLLAEMLGDRDLEQYEMVVLDEAHERSLRTDMLMGFLKDIQRRRKAKVEAWSKSQEGDRPTLLKIIIMSATIDAKRFSQFFDNAPVLYVKGREHSVQVFYASEPVVDYIQAALQTIYRIHLSRPPGDILVFLPGQDDIESLTAAIETYLPSLKQQGKADDIQVCPLYAKLPAKEQANAFIAAPPNTRKVILSTNVAETSVTIPGIVYVIDTGLAKEKEFHSNVGIDSLVSTSISQSNAKQRSGRAGRERPGVCFRLYTENTFLEMEKTMKPEIQRVSLTFAILHLLAAGQETVWTFEFMDRPSKDSIVNALTTLRGLEAINDKGAITAIGRKMSIIPLDPVYSRILLASVDENCVKEMIDLVSVIANRDNMLINTVATRDKANEARRKFAHRTGDHIMLLNILKAFEDIPSAEQKGWCRENFVNMKTLKQVLDSRKQLIERCGKLGIDCSLSMGDDVEPLLRACVAGLFGNTALLQSDGSYRHTITRQAVAIHPGSVLHGKKAPAIIYDELVLTTKTYARGVSLIELSWLKSMAPQMFNNLM